MTMAFMGRIVTHNSPAKVSKKKAKSPLLEEAMHEVFTDVPKNVKKTGKTGAAKRKMMVAIAFSKARRRGANV